MKTEFGQVEQDLQEGTRERRWREKVDGVSTCENVLPATSRDLTTDVLIGIQTIVNPSISAIALRTLTVEVVRAGSVLQREASRLFRRLGVTAAQFNALNLLAARLDGVRASELALSLVVDPSSTTYILDQLEARGLVARRRDADDRRALKVVLTAAGRRLHAKLVPVYQRALEKMAEAFSEEEISGALPFLEKLPGATVEAIDAILEEAGKPVAAKGGARPRRKAR